MSDPLHAEIREALAATERGETEDLGTFAQPTETEEEETADAEAE